MARTTPIKINKQGARVLSGNKAVILKGNRKANVICLTIDMRSKHCDASCFYTSAKEGPGLMIHATPRSLHLKNKVKKGEYTDISLPEFKGWDVFATASGRYEVSVCIVKNNR